MERFTEISLLLILGSLLLEQIVNCSPVGHASTEVVTTSHRTRPRDLLLFPGTSEESDSSFVILHQRVNDKVRGKDSEGYTKVRPENEYNSVKSKSSLNDNSNVFIFCLMFLFGLIMSGLVWCLCAAGRNLGRAHDNDGSRRSSRFSRMSTDRPGANIHAIFPDTTDLPPAYNEIFSEYDKLGSQCILPSYKEIMSQSLNVKDAAAATATGSTTPSSSLN